MTTITTTTILINELTQDEDKRQDLWLYVLSGNSDLSLERYLCALKMDEQFYGLIKDKISDARWSFGDFEQFGSFLEQFSEFEQSVIMMMYLGLTILEMSECLDISMMRVRQVIRTIKDHPAWKSVR